MSTYNWRSMGSAARCDWVIPNYGDWRNEPPPIDAETAALDDGAKEAILRRRAKFDDDVIRVRDKFVPEKWDNQISGITFYPDLHQQNVGVELTCSRIEGDKIFDNRDPSIYWPRSQCRKVREELEPRSEEGYELSDAGNTVDKTVHRWVHNKTQRCIWLYTDGHWEKGMDGTKYPTWLELKKTLKP